MRSCRCYQKINKNKCGIGAGSISGPDGWFLIIVDGSSSAHIKENVWKFVNVIWYVNVGKERETSC